MRAPLSVKRVLVSPCGSHGRNDQKMASMVLGSLFRLTLIDQDFAVVNDDGVASI
jgi:hypothetical protein